MIEELKTKTQPVSKEQVWSAWKRIKRGGKGVGVDQVSIAMIEKNPRKYLYPLWEAGKALAKYKNYLEKKWAPGGLDGLISTPQ